MDSSTNKQPSNPPHPSLSHQLTTHTTPSQTSTSPLSSAQQEPSDNESHLPGCVPLISASAEQLDEIEMATAMRFKRALEKSLGMEFPEEPNQFAKDLGCHTAADCDAKLTDLDRFLATLPASAPITQWLWKIKNEKELMERKKQEDLKWAELRARSIAMEERKKGHKVEGDRTQLLVDALKKKRKYKIPLPNVPIPPKPRVIVGQPLHAEEKLEAVSPLTDIQTLKTDTVEEDECSGKTS